MNETDSTLLRLALQDIAEAILRQEYAKDVRNTTALTMLAEGDFELYLKMKRGEPY